MHHARRYRVPRSTWLESMAGLHHEIHDGDARRDVTVGAFAPKMIAASAGATKLRQCPSARHDATLTFWNRCICRPSLSCLDQPEASTRLSGQRSSFIYDDTRGEESLVC